MTLKFSPFTDGAALVKAASVLVVPYQQQASEPTRGGSGGHSAPDPGGPSDDPGPDDDIPF